jgi:hypothetical protein
MGCGMFRLLNTVFACAVFALSPLSAHSDFGLTPKGDHPILDFRTNISSDN